MEKIVIHIGETGRDIDLIDFPHLSSSKPLIQKGITVLHQHAPRIIHFLSRQRAFSHLQNTPLQVQVPQDMEEGEARAILGRWIRQKRLRRFVYVAFEIAVLPLALIAGVLPGPNILFYSIFVLLYFHFRALIFLGKIRAQSIPLEIVHSPMEKGKLPPN